jgi:OOP family OmpA-OmpF porin
MELSAHTDFIGSDGYNQRLSENRAKGVYHYLVTHGVPADKILWSAYGEKRPVAAGKDPKSRQRNRRVEVYVQSVSKLS